MKYVFRPNTVEAIRFTGEWDSVEQVFQWFQKLPPQKYRIRYYQDERIFAVLDPKGRIDDTANAGEWLVQTKGGIVVFSDEAFNDTFLRQE